MARPPARPALLRTLNDRTVVELLLAHGPLTRAEIATLSGLSKPTAGEALTRLLAEGVVDHAGVSSGRPGPSAQAYAVDTRRVLAAAVTVTAKKIVLDVVDVAGVRDRLRREPPPGHGAARGSRTPLLRGRSPPAAAASTPSSSRCPASTTPRPTSSAMPTASPSGRVPVSRRSCATLGIEPRDDRQRREPRRRRRAAAAARARTSRASRCSGSTTASASRSTPTASLHRGATGDRR